LSTRLVFVHGAGSTEDVFAAQTHALDDAVALTLPGHTTPGEPASIEEFADAVTLELEQLDIENAIVCGHSMGGAVALELALRREPRVRAIVMLASGAKLRVAPAILDLLERNFDAAAREIVRLSFADPTPQRVAASVKLMQTVGQAQTLRDFHACDAFDRVGRLQEVDLPLLALTGARDVMTPPKYAQALADRVPRAVARILPGAGHFAMVERPAEVNDALRSFVMQLESSI
jgi:3-oxoadipate enol-lactonase